MYQVGELVQYGNSGVCKIEEIVQGVPGLQKDTRCYLLIPVNGRDGKIYSPVDSGKVKMRRILSGEEVRDLMGKAPQIEELTILNEKQCESVYKEELYSVDCYRWLGLLKTLYSRRAARLLAGKKVTATDERYLKSVEDRLREELSIVIGAEETKNELQKLSETVK
jgi:CarD family transcriptional regulator